jgi:hypothetical protein
VVLKKSKKVEIDEENKTREELDTLELVGIFNTDMIPESFNFTFKYNSNTLKNQGYFPVSYLITGQT